MSKPVYMPPKKTVIYRGEKLTVYSVGWFALVLSRSPASIRLWERKGFLPRPILAVPKDARRYYTVAELLGYSEIYRRANVRRNNQTEDTSFKQDCHTFNAHLKASLKDNPKILGTKLDVSSITLLEGRRVKVEEKFQQRRVRRINKILENMGSDSKLVD